jgi:hypothetical protein
MNELYITIGILLTIIIGILAWGLRNYVNEKFKNLATEQDIKGITKIVEKVKHELSVLTNKRNVLFNEEKEALVSFLSVWSIWYSYIKSMEDFHKVSDYEVLSDISKKYNTDYDKVLLAMSKVELFLNNEEIVRASHNLIQATFVIQECNEKHILVFHRRRLEMNSAQEEKRRDLLSIAIEKNDEAMLNFGEEVRPLHTKNDEARAKFISLSKAYIRKDI